MKYCHFAFDERPEHCSYHINRHQDSSVFPYYVPSMGMDAQGPRYFTDRCGFEMLFVCLTLEGSGAVTAGEEGHILLPGDLMVLDGFKPHRYESRSELWRFLWIHVKGYGAREFFNRMAPSGLLYRRIRNDNLSGVFRISRSKNSRLFYLYSSDSEASSSFCVSFGCTNPYRIFFNRPKNARR